MTVQILIDASGEDELLLYSVDENNQTEVLETFTDLYEAAAKQAEYQKLILN